MTSSPLARFPSRNLNGQLQMYQPGLSSPLSGLSSPTYNVEARRKRQYKAQGSLRSSLPTPSLFSAFEDTSRKTFLRERFKTQCIERARKGRGRTVQTSRDIRYSNGSSSDGFEMDEDPMVEEDEDVFNDEIYRRVMLNETRRSQYAKRVSFEQEFGSSIDPNMYEDMDALEWEYTGHASQEQNLSPPPDEADDALIQEYLSELEELEQHEARQAAMAVPTGARDIDSEDPSDLEHVFIAQNNVEPPSPPPSMFSDFLMSSPPCSPSRERGSGSPSPLCATWSCPFCTMQTSRSHIACAACATQYPLDHAHSVWFDVDSHPGVQGSNHTPLATKAPSESGVGVVMLCGAPECEWCFAL